MTKRSNTLKIRQLLKPEKRLRARGFRDIAGVDEAGRGPLAGPVVAGAVIIHDTSFSVRIDDSKKLSPRERDRAYEEILSRASVGIGIVDEKGIDALNIYQATRQAMALAVARLPRQPDYILIDGTMRFPADCPSESIVAGDSKSLSIAAASIVAKVTRDRIMIAFDRTYPQYGFARHKGYPTAYHKEALAAHGPSPLHRLTFRPVIESAR